MFFVQNDVEGKLNMGFWCNVNLQDYYKLILQFFSLQFQCINFDLSGITHSFLLIRFGFSNFLLNFWEIGIVYFFICINDIVNLRFPQIIMQQGLFISWKHLCFTFFPLILWNRFSQIICCHCSLISSLSIYSVSRIIWRYW